MATQKKECGVLVAAGTTLTATAFASLTPTTALGVEQWDTVTLEIDYTPGTGGGSPLLEVLPVVSAAADGATPVWMPAVMQTTLGAPSAGHVHAAQDAVVFTRAVAGKFPVRVPVGAHTLFGVLVRESGGPGAFGSVGITARVTRER